MRRGVRGASHSASGPGWSRAITLHLLLILTKLICKATAMVAHMADLASAKTLPHARNQLATWTGAKRHGAIDLGE